MRLTTGGLVNAWLSIPLPIKKQEKSWSLLTEDLTFEQGGLSFRSHRSFFSWIYQRPRRRRLVLTPSRVMSSPFLAFSLQLYHSKRWKSFVNVD